MNASELRHQRAIFERAHMGVVEAGLDGCVQYANPQAMDLLGLSSYEGLHLSSLYANPKLLEEQLESRRSGAIGNYQTELVRQSDRERLPVRVTAIPILNGTGEVTGTFALFRHPLEEEINRIHQEVDDPRSVLFRIMQELQKVIPFDLATASRYSEDLQHTQPFFVYRPRLRKAKVEWKNRWHVIPPELVPDIEQTETLLYSDLQLRLTHPAMSAMRDTPLVQELIAEQMQCCIRRPIGRKLRASMTFYSRSPAGLTEEHRSRLEELPLAASVIQAIEHFDRRRETEQYKLLREVAFCPSVDAVYDVLLRRLCDIFAWTNVAIYRVDHARGRVKLVAACEPPRQPVIKGLTYEQEISRGVLGRAVRTGLPQIVPEISDDPDYVPNEPPTAMRSEMCWPIRLDDAKTRWIIDVEDPRPNAFSEEEKRWLGETAREVGGFMQRLSTLNFLSECLEHTSEPIVVVDSHNEIKRTNPAAAEFFGAPDHKGLKGSLETLFGTADLAQRAMALPHGYLGEFAVRRISGETLEADISRKPLPDDIGGAIYVFKDMRPIRRSLELELMEQTAYEIAIETRTPLTFAVSTLERAVRNGEPLAHAGAERVLKYLYRTQHAYTKLAMFNGSVRSSSGAPRSLDLLAEVRAIHRWLPPEMGSLVTILHDGEAAKIVGDCFQISLVLETVLMFFVRTAPEEIPVVVRVSASGATVTVSVQGFLPNSWPASDSGVPNQRANSELRLALPLIVDYLQRNGAFYEEERLSGDEVRYKLVFPRAG